MHCPLTLPASQLCKKRYYLFQPWTVRHGNVLQGQHPTLVNRTTFPDHFRLRSPQVEQDDIPPVRMRLTIKSVILTRDDKKR